MIITERAKFRWSLVDTVEMAPSLKYCDYYTKGKIPLVASDYCRKGTTPLVTISYCTQGTTPIVASRYCVKGVIPMVIIVTTGYQ